MVRSRKDKGGSAGSNMTTKQKRNTAKRAKLRQARRHKKD